MRTLADLQLLAQDLGSGGTPGLPVPLAPELRERFTPSKAKDMVTHGRYIAQSFGVARPEDVPVARLTKDHEATLHKHLQATEKGVAVCRNTIASYKLLRSLAISQAILPSDPAPIRKPKRERITRRGEGGKREVLRGKLREQVAPYAIKRENMAPALQEEIGKLEHFYTAHIVRKRRRAANRDTTWKEGLHRLERIAGALVQMGHPLEALTLKDFTDLDRIEEIIEHFIRNHGAPTRTLYDLIAWLANIAKNYSGDKALSDEIWSVNTQLKLRPYKNLEQIVERVTDEDVLKLSDSLYEQARYYEQKFYHRKPSRVVKNPQAMTAYHWCRALVVHLAAITLLRRSNLFGILDGVNLYERNGQLRFHFEAEEMKSGEEHNGEVRDLLRGRAGYNRLVEILERYRELRHHLVDEFLEDNPGKEPPRQLLLNMKGKPFAQNSQWNLFSSVSRQYLGSDKEFSPHCVRLIVPTYLMLKYGYEIMPHLQALLDHASIETTEKHYIRLKKLLSGEMSQQILDEHDARRRGREQIERLETLLLGLKDDFARKFG
jgi:integrase